MLVPKRQTCAHLLGQDIFVEPGNLVTYGPASLGESQSFPPDVLLPLQGSVKKWKHQFQGISNRCCFSFGKIFLSLHAHCSKHSPPLQGSHCSPFPWNNPLKEFRLENKAGLYWCWPHHKGLKNKKARLPFQDEVGKIENKLQIKILMNNSVTSAARWPWKRPRIIPDLQHHHNPRSKKRKLILVRIKGEYAWKMSCWY